MDAIPQFLIEKLQVQYGDELLERIIDGYSCRRKVSLRVNPLKGEPKETISELSSAGIELTPVSWYPDAYILPSSCEFDIEGLDVYESGKVYMQSLSSMLPPLLMPLKQGIDILDMAAAPGGKTTQICALCDNKCRITACEMNSIRAKRLRYNIEKQGANAYVMETDSRNLDSAFSFDTILLDAPCSGSGTLSTVKDSSVRFTPQLIDKCVKAQKSLISKAIEVLKVGGEVIYSTCSILKEENEDIINLALKSGCVEVIPLDEEWLSQLPTLPTAIDGTLCVCPNEYFEGFFVAKLKKTGKFSARTSNPGVTSHKKHKKYNSGR